MMVKIATWEDFADPDANGFCDVFASHMTDDQIRLYVNVEYQCMEEVIDHLRIIETTVIGAFN